MGRSLPPRGDSRKKQCRKDKTAIVALAASRQKRDQINDAVQSKINGTQGSAPLRTFILKPDRNDVLLGRGPAIAHHNGRTTWRSLVDEYRADYGECHSRELKSKIIRYILHETKRRKSAGSKGEGGGGGRFLNSVEGVISSPPPAKKKKRKSSLGKKQAKYRGWYEVDTSIGYKKTAQALRDTFETKASKRLQEAAAALKEISDKDRLSRRKRVLALAAGTPIDYGDASNDGGGDSPCDSEDDSAELGQLLLSANPLLSLARSASQQAAMLDDFFSSSLQESSTTATNITREKMAPPATEAKPGPAASWYSNDSSSVRPPPKNKKNSLADPFASSLKQNEFLDQSSIRASEDEISRIVRDGAIPLLSLGGGILGYSDNSLHTAGSPPNGKLTSLQTAAALASSMAATAPIATATTVPGMELTMLERGESNDLSTFSVLSVKEKLIHGLDGTGKHLLYNGAAASQHQQKDCQQQTFWSTYGQVVEAAAGVAAMPPPSNSQESSGSNELSYTVSLPLEVSPMKQQLHGHHYDGNRLLGAAIQARDNESDDGGGKLSAVTSPLMDFGASGNAYMNYDDEDESHTAFGNTYSSVSVEAAAGDKKKAVHANLKSEDSDLAHLSLSTKLASQTEPTVGEDRTTTPSLVQTAPYCDSAAASAIKRPSPYALVNNAAMTGVLDLHAEDTRVCQEWIYQIHRDQQYFTEEMNHTKVYMEQVLKMGSAQQAKNDNDILNLKHQYADLGCGHIAMEMDIEEMEEMADALGESSVEWI